jgi:hypothetical protein
MITNDDFPLDCKGHDLPLNITVGNAEKICCLCGQIPFGQIDAALSRGKSENVEYSAAYADGSEIISECFASVYGSKKTLNFALMFIEKCGNMEP